MAQIALIALIILGYALVAARLDRRSISGPIVLVTVGAIIGAAGLALVQAPATSEPVQLLAEFTLAILLFTDAIDRYEQGSGRPEPSRGFPGRLLAIGLPLTIALGGFVGWLLFPELGIGFALLLGTDPGPDRRRPQPAGPAEQGHPGPGPANDQYRERDSTTASPRRLSWPCSSPSPWPKDRGSQAWLLPALLRSSSPSSSPPSSAGSVGASRSGSARGGRPRLRVLAVVAMAIFAYAAATAVGGNGFVSAFAAGIAFHTATARSEPSVEFAESLGVSASYLVWLLFGIGLAGPVIAAGLDPVLIGYAVLSLTVIRVGPVAIALLRSPLRPDTVAMIGWFGPRGLASVVFLLVAIEDLGPAHPASLALVQVVTWTVLLSVFIHGLSAGPVSARYARRIATAAPDAWGGRGGERAADQPRPGLARR